MKTKKCSETIHRVLKPLLSTYEAVLEALSGPESNGNADMKDRVMMTYSRLKGFSAHLPALHAVNLIIAVPVVLSLLVPILLSYVVFVLPALNACVSLSYLLMLSNLLRISVMSSLQNRKRQTRRLSRKIVPDSKIATHAATHVSSA
jgi:hypothetical protein